MYKIRPSGGWGRKKAPTPSPGSDRITLSFYKLLIEYLASKTTDVEFDLMYTEEKKIALKRTLTSQGNLVSNSINDLSELKKYMDDNLTMDDLPLRAATQRVLHNLKYEKELIDSFKDELGK